MDLKLLKEYRMLRKISIKSMSKATGIHRDRISLIERGMVNPSFETVKEIADYLGLEMLLVIKQ